LPTKHIKDLAYNYYVVDFKMRKSKFDLAIRILICDCFACWLESDVLGLCTASNFIFSGTIREMSIKTKILLSA